mgnify:CR=1 FL=1
MTAYTLRDELASTISDMYKDINGYRPRHLDFSTMSIASMESMINDLEIELKQVMLDDEVRQQANIVRFERRVEETIAMGAGDRETAIRWIHDAENTHGDDDYLCFTLDLPYGYFDSNNSCKDKKMSV